MGSLQNMVLLLLAAVIAVPLFKRAGLGTVLGYLAAGVLIGPHGLRLFTDVGAMVHVSEFGVVLLMFVIGLELQLSRLKALRKPIFSTGAVQFLLCTLALGLLTWRLERSVPVALVVGAGLALSSTAFVLQLLAEKRQLTTGYGRLAFTILLFQDLAVVPLLALLPPLAGHGGATSPEAAALHVLRIAVVFAAIVLVGRFALRHALTYINATRVREISVAGALLVVTGVAWIMSEAGLSMALGAFVAGVLLADSEYRHQLEADIEPFKGLLLGLFFLSVGMTLNVSLVLAEPAALLGAAVALMAVKTLIVFAIGKRLHRLDNDGALRLGLLLSQGGEFGFVVFALAGRLEILPSPLGERLAVVVTLSMALTPALYILYERVAARWTASKPAPFDRIDDPAGSVIIAGFGRFGQIAGRLLATMEVAFTALDVNAEQVAVVRRFGNKVHFGDASQLDVLRAAGIANARVLVLAVDDPVASLRAAEIVRRDFPSVRILARARNRFHAHRLMDVGVDWIIRDTFVSALELAEQMLVEIGKSRGEAQQMIRLFRETDEKTLRAQHGIHHDRERLIQTSREATEELRRLFEEDRRSRAAKP